MVAGFAGVVPGLAGPSARAERVRVSRDGSARGSGAAMRAQAHRPAAARAARRNFTKVFSAS